MKSNQYQIKERSSTTNELITHENVRYIGERIALSAVRNMRVFAHYPKSLDKLYEGLIEDKNMGKILQGGQGKKPRVWRKWNWSIYCKGYNGFDSYELRCRKYHIWS